MKWNSISRSEHTSPLIPCLRQGLESQADLVMPRKEVWGREMDRGVGMWGGLS